MRKSFPNHGEGQNELCGIFHKFELLAHAFTNSCSQNPRRLDVEFLLRGTKNWWNDTFFHDKGDESIDGKRGIRRLFRVCMKDADRWKEELAKTDNVLRIRARRKLDS